MMMMTCAAAAAAASGCNRTLIRMSSSGGCEEKEKTERVFTYSLKWQPEQGRLKFKIFSTILLRIQFHVSLIYTNLIVSMEIVRMNYLFKYELNLTGFSNPRNAPEFSNLTSECPCQRINEIHPKTPSKSNQINTRTVQETFPTALNPSSSQPGLSSLIKHSLYFNRPKCHLIHPSFNYNSKTTCLHFMSIKRISRP